jgi:putative ABC transport system ATP-binding protein
LYNSENSLFELNNIAIRPEGKNPLLFPDITIKSGLHTCISGESGSGKSTLLRLLNRMISPEKGFVKYLGQNVQSIKPELLRREVTMVGQEPFVPPGKLRDFMDFLCSFKTRKHQTYDDIFPLLPSIGLKDIKPDTELSHLSGGEKQRLSIAIAICLKPKVLLLDEPSSALDNDSALKLFQFISNYPEISVVSVSHSPEWIKLCSAIIELKK